MTTIPTILNTTSVILPSVGLQGELLGNTITAFLTLISGYLLLALAIFEYKQTRCARSWTNRLCLLSAMVSLLSCLSEQLELRFGKVSDGWCEAYTHLISAFYCIGSLSAYTLLWMRQRSFYSDPLLRNYSSKTLRFISASIIVGIFAALISTVFAFTMNYSLHSTNSGCILSLETTDSSTVVIPVIVMATSYVAFQISLLMLVVYPLAKSAGLENRSCFCPFRLLHCSNEVVYMIRRMALCTAVCVTSALLSSTIAALSVLLAPDSYWSLVVHADLVINTIAIICSFANWRERLLPFKCCISEPVQNQERAESSGEIILDSVNCVDPI
uniref:G-protein coupled receptors family 1 profile domain-containing protein n=1 Tax=Ciona savignyi TaxID=51511 RepID=H2YC49_CIOSA